MLHSAFFVLFVTILLAGCQLPGSQLVVERGQAEIALVWPPPPQPPRIRFVKTVTRPRDLDIQPSFLERLARAVFGEKEEWFVRPTGVAVDGETIYVTDPGAQALWILNPGRGEFYKVEQAGEAQLISPVSVAVGSKNRIYLADSYLAKVFIFDAKGNPIGAIADPIFRRPAGLAFDPARDGLYVVDSASHSVVLFTVEGRRERVIGRRGNGSGEFNFPTHVTVDRQGNLYVTDSLGYRVQIFGPDGNFRGQLGRHGDSSGDFASPKGIAVDSEGHVYVVDALFDAVQIFERTGVYLLTFGARGVRPGQFWLPGGIFIDSRDTIYVADSFNQRVQIFQYLKGEAP